MALSAQDAARTELFLWRFCDNPQIRFYHSYRSRGASRRWDIVLGGYGNTWDLLRVRRENRPLGIEGVQEAL